MGDIFIADTHNHRIQKWAKGATSGITVAGNRNKPGSGDKYLRFPVDVTLDLRGNLYIADRDNHRIQKWSSGYNVSTLVAGTGSKDAKFKQLNYPESVTIDAAGNIYVSDTRNHIIQKWTLGAEEGISIIGGNGSGNVLNKLNFPRDIAFDKDQNLYVSNGDNYRVLKIKNKLISSK